MQYLIIQTNNENDIKGLLKDYFFWTIHYLGNLLNIYITSVIVINKYTYKQ